MAERLSILALGANGDGIAHTEGRTVYVPYALPGETAVASTDGPKPLLERIENPSPDRIEPFCPYFTRCGGCTVQHVSPPAYAEWKRNKVAAALHANGVQTALRDLVDAHGTGRRRVLLHLRHVDGRLRAGFMEAGTHRLVPIDRCPITVSALAEAPSVAEAIGACVQHRGKPLNVLVSATRNGLDVELRGSGRPDEQTTQALIRAADALHLARLAVHGDVVVARLPPATGIAESTVIPPPGAFLQATEAGEGALAALVCAMAEGRRRVVDLFSGIGPFSLRLARMAEVHAVESDRAMLAALDRAARETPGLRRVTTEARDLFRRPLLSAEFDRFDFAVLNPPRQGAEAQVNEIAVSSLERVAMVSCDAGTFARDASRLCEAGFSLDEVTPVDQFKWSAHIEMVGRFTRPPRRTRRLGRRRL